MGIRNWGKVGFVNGNGNSNSPKEYSFIDKNVLNGNYSYRLKQIDNDGQYKYSGEIEVDVNILPIEFSLSQNYPNPFNPSTTLKYSLPNTSNVELRIYDLLGREVKTLVSGYQSAGYKEIVWDGRNNTDEQVSSGIYIYKLTASSIETEIVIEKSAKLVLMK
ncbi:MAG: T9SS type A sorting domain-containing protein [Ignavibacteriales bacterium]|nr:T9SS type A sorting domain-containing protein [Ignavibacteriales bacterium]